MKHLKRIKKICDNSGLYHTGGLLSENQRKLKERQVLGSGREKLGNMRVTVITIVIGALGTVSKRLEKELKELEIGEQAVTIQTTGRPEY